MEEQDPENDCWKWGFIYYNPADSRLIVSKRYGFGWTFNFANLWAYVLLLAIFAVAFLIKHYSA